MTEFDDDIAAIGEIDAVPQILDIVCRTTGMGFAAVARVTDERWVACRVHDDIGFGLEAGGELSIETTICNDIRRERAAVVIDAVSDDAFYRTHPTPAMYGFQSYVSVPILLKDGTFFGTLCAIDPKPAKVDNPAIRGMFALFAELIASQLQTNRRFNASVEKQREIEDRLRQSQKMEAVGQLTGGLAHDFNNLLAGIVGSLDLMQIRLSQGRTGEIGRYITAAQGASRRATALTQRLLAFSRQQTLSPRVTDVNRLVAGMDELIGRSIGAQIDFRIVGSPDAWPVRIDQNELESALLNLCINARDAMPDGGTLTVGTENRSVAADEADGTLAAGDYLRLCVTDTGAGMPPDVVARAFDPFFTTKPTGLGTGLGLSMVYGFARQSGGHVRIDSQPGRGTRVAIDLPRYDGDERPTSDEPTVAPAAPSKSVLVVDHEPSVRLLISDLLLEMGYAAIEASDATEALRLLATDRTVALLITEIGAAGGLDGRRLADAARVGRPSLKVVLVGAYTAADGPLPADTQVVAKPFVVETLGQQIRDFIEG